ncbi:MAG: peptidase S1 [Acidobacteria bacterium]|nr:MAG: peptidase S1 [Acidobacteriota bacterium]
MPAALFEALSQVAEQVRRSTVQVEGAGRGGGSGVIWRSDGLIVTNAHVAQRTVGRIRFSDGRVVQAKVAARDPKLDLALLAADARDLPAAPVADSDELRAGQLVLAVGSPYGHAGVVAVGVVHASAERRWVQADVKLAPGNSGGPLADADGRVIGINTMVANGVALAVPSNIVERFVERGGRPARRLGVTVEPVNAVGFGLLILDIEPASPAENAGLRVGDILTGSGGRPFQAPFDLALSLEVSGGLVELDLLRGGRRASCEVTFDLPAVGADVG